MKKIAEKEITVCDLCGKEADYACQCLRCGKDMCNHCVYESDGKMAVRYGHGVYSRRSGDGYYCRPCDIALYEGEGDALYEAYRAVKALREEEEAFSKDFQRRKALAEIRVDGLCRAKGI